MKYYLVQYIISWGGIGQLIHPQRSIMVEVEDMKPTDLFKQISQQIEDEFNKDLLPEEKSKVIITNITEFK